VPFVTLSPAPKALQVADNSPASAGVRPTWEMLDDACALLADGTVGLSPAESWALLHAPASSATTSVVAQTNCRFINISVS
jgi:hypothetical protein